MKVLVAGATGALGQQLLARLVACGHEVVGMTRCGSKRGVVHDLGAAPVVADALDPEQVARADRAPASAPPPSDGPRSTASRARCCSTPRAG